MDTTFSARTSNQKFSHRVEEAQGEEIKSLLTRTKNKDEYAKQSSAVVEDVPERNRLRSYRSISNSIGRTASNLILRPKSAKVIPKTQSPQIKMSIIADRAAVRTPN